MSQHLQDCLSAETIASFVEGRLDPEAACAVAEHIADCDTCIELVRTVAAFERESRPLAKATVRGWNRFPALQRHYGIAAVVVVLASLMFVLWQWSRMREPMTRLASAASGSRHRPTEARISMLPYAPASTPRGAADFSYDLKRLQLQKVASDILAAAPGGDAASVRARGVAWLVTGGTTHAVDELSRAVKLDPTQPQYWNDLAAARYTLGVREQDAHRLIEALADADESLRRSPESPEALFNRALILESLHLWAPAIAAYERYLSVDRSSQWAAEARSRRAALKSRTIRSWNNGRPLLDAVSAGDTARVSAVVTEFRQESRTWGETIVLRDWAVAIEAGNASAAAATLRVALRTGEVLSEQTGERLVLDAALAASKARRPHALAAAHRAYDSGRALYGGARRSRDALPLFERAAETFVREGSPMAGMAEYYRAACLFDLNDVDASSKALDRLDASLPAHYAALRAQIWWQRGTAYARAGRLQEAIDCYARARVRFAVVGEHHNVALLGNSIAAVEAAIGRPGDAWRERLEVFRELSDSANASGLQLACELAARTEALTNRWDTARSLLTLSLDPALRINGSLTVNALLWRALAADRLDDHAAAMADLSAARRTLAHILDPDLRAAADAQADFVKARVFSSERPARALQLLTSMIARTTEAKNYFLLPEAYLERGRLYRRLGDHAAAMHDFRSALAGVDARRGTPTDAFRDTYFATSTAAATELADLLERAEEPGNALVVIEAARGRSITDRIGRVFPTRTTEQFVAPDGVLIVVYAVLDQRLVVFTIEGAEVTHRTVSIAPARLDADVRLMIDDPDSEDAKRASEELFDLLIGPIAAQVTRSRALVVVPDQHLRGLPFAALRDHASGEFLIQRVSIIHDPSVGTYTALAGRRTRPRRAPSLLAIGNPAFDVKRFPDLNRLPLAGREVQVIASHYSEAAVFTGGDATRAAFLRNAASATAIQIATHAVQNAREPQMSFLALAPEGEDSGLLYAHEIAKLDLTRTEIVVLAGCRTASRADAETDLTNLALAFLAAGAPHVVGTLWDVEDGVSHAFSIAFHRRLRAGVAPADALRQVQLEMARSFDPRLRPVSAWAAFQLIGSGS